MIETILLAFIIMALVVEAFGLTMQRNRVDDMINRVDLVAAALAEWKADLEDLEIRVSNLSSAINAMDRYVRSSIEIDARAANEK